MKYHSRKRLVVVCGAGHSVILKKSAPESQKDKPIGELAPCLVCGRVPYEVIIAFEEKEETS